MKHLKSLSPYKGKLFNSNTARRYIHSNTDKFIYNSCQSKKQKEYLHFNKNANDLIQKIKAERRENPVVILSGKVF